MKGSQLDDVLSVFVLLLLILLLAFLFVGEPDVWDALRSLVMQAAHVQQCRQ